MARAARGEGTDELQSRDENGWLIRVDEATEQDLDEEITIVVDGVSLTVHKARMATDAQGNPLKNSDGSPQVRATTILDAIRAATNHGEQLRDDVATMLGWRGAEASPNVVLGKVLQVTAERGREYAFVGALVRHAEADAEFAQQMYALLEHCFSSRARDRSRDGGDTATSRLPVSFLPQQIHTLLDGRILFPPTEDRAIARVPVLCHQEHLNPVAMCRVCAVRIATVKRGRLSLGRSLVPACQHRVEAGIPVFTMWSSAAEGWRPPEAEGDDTYKAASGFARKADELRVGVRRSVQMLTELLTSQCWHPEKEDPVTGRGAKYRNELTQLRQIMEANSAAFPQDSPPLKFDERGLPTQLERGTAAQHVVWRRLTAAGPAGPPIPLDNSPLLVDYDSCILCDRCIRSCHDVRHFNVIGRSGKGAGTHIAFDLDGLAMYPSSCHSCGECMKACPTGAIVFDQPVLPLPQPGVKPSKATKMWVRDLALQSATVVEVDELLRHPRFRKMSHAFLAWNKGAVRRRQLSPGQVIAEEGEFGNTAFILEDALIGVFRRDESMTSRPALGGELQQWQSLQDRYWKSCGRIVREINPRDYPLRILGEMSPMTHDRRTASMVALSAGTILEIDRNVLSELLRIPEIRQEIQQNYAIQALSNFTSDARQNKSGPRFEQLQASLFGPPDKAWGFRGRKIPLTGVDDQELDAILHVLSAQAQLVSVKKGDLICRRNDTARDFFFVYQGFVQIETRKELFCRGQGTFFGEFPAVGLAQELKVPMPYVLTAAARESDYEDRMPKRSGAIVALDSVELLRFPLVPFVDYLLMPQQQGVLRKLSERLQQMTQS